jgi:hypothetical protein
MHRQKEWEPPLEFPEFKFKWGRGGFRYKQQVVTKPVLVKPNGHPIQTRSEIEENGKKQALNIFKGLTMADLHVIEVVELTKIVGWVVVVQNKI